MQSPESIMRDITAFWQSGQMHGESILPIRSQTDVNTTVKLAFVPGDLPRLVKCDLTQTYEPGKDFTWEPGSNEINIPADSRIIVIRESDLYRPAHSQRHGKCRDQDRDIFFAPKGQYRDMQTAVSYAFDVKQWKLAMRMQPAGTLPNITAKLTAGDPVNLVFMGDSITTGCDVSGKYNVAPNAPGYAQLLTDAISQKFSCKVNAQNLAVGGKTSDWGLEQTDNIIAQKPDLVVLAFGMNDASHQTTALKFQGNISQMIVDIKASCPTCEFMLVATMTANAEWEHASPELYPQYREVLSLLQGTGIIMADVYSLWDELVKRKGYLSFTANGLNHPNDFGHRLYAQTLWASLLHTVGVQSM